MNVPHLTAHWVDEDEGAPVGVHHHLKEVWEDEAEGSATLAESQELPKSAA